MKQDAIKVHRDFGILGPDSVTWKVFSFPTAMTVGFQRTVVAEMFEPFLMASVADTNAVMSRPALRYDRTLQYVSTIAFHDSQTAVASADVLLKIHSRIRGKEPLSGLEYDANHPDSQLWIHLTQWQSVLHVYEKFGPGPLSEDEDRRYWAECKLASEFQTINPDDVPKSRQEMREYYARMRPRLAATETTQETVAHLLAARHLPSLVPWYIKPIAAAATVLFRRATIATLPHWLRQLGGIRQSRLQDSVITAITRLVFRVALRSPQSQLTLLKMVSPQTYPVVAPAFLNRTPEILETVSPDEAWKRAGKIKPREQYLQECQSRPKAGEKAPKDTGEEDLLKFG
jgi:uncharacterized protein (DUF2236 family)